VKESEEQLAQLCLGRSTEPMMGESRVAGAVAVASDASSPSIDEVNVEVAAYRFCESVLLQNPVLCAPILITRADMGLPPLHIDWSCRH
jgi:hypothetical protein